MITRRATSSTWLAITPGLIVIEGAELRIQHDPVDVALLVIGAPTHTVRVMSDIYPWQHAPKSITTIWPLLISPGVARPCGIAPRSPAATIVSKAGGPSPRLRRK